MGCIKNWADFESYAWPKPRTSISPLLSAGALLPDGMKITLLLGHVLEDAMNLMGYEGLAIALYDQPDG